MAKKTKDKPHDPKELTLVEHLEELRTRIIICFLALTVGAIISWFFVDHIMEIVQWPYYQVSHKKLLVMAPAEAFLARMKGAIWTSFVLTFPVLITQIWAFIKPGLYPKEQKLGVVIVPSLVGLFVTGVVFGYFTSPTVLNFFFLQGAGFESMFSLEKYLGFLMDYLLAFGAGFELPAVLVGLVALGLVSPATLASKRSVVHFILAVVSALLMPGDVATMVILWIPLSALFEGSLLVIRMFKIGSSHWLSDGAA